MWSLLSGCEIKCHNILIVIISQNDFVTIVKNKVWSSQCVIVFLSDSNDLLYQSTSVNITILTILEHQWATGAHWRSDN